MNAILFPTDFSDVSMNAFTYAVAYAKRTDKKIIIFHAYDSKSNLSTAEQEIYDQVDIQNFRKSKDKFPPFEKILSAKKLSALKVKYVVAEGAFIDTFTQYIAKREDKIDLVVMGTQTMAGGLFDLFTETNTIKLLDEIHKPIIVVPSQAVFDGNLNNILFLIDYHEDEKEPLADLIQESKEFNAKLHVVHFDLAHGDSIAPLMDKFKASLGTHKFKNVIFKTIDSIDLKRSLLDYCKENSIDMVCLINNKRNFYQRLFTYSLTEDLIRHMNTPVMAIYRD